ncbi:MAG: AbrB/MazE/SpoVT family DNA-binding domain-containing protein [Clostridia bacterium]|nr:AbrB/MazE/SpoVT family DNA-binding domain-containing protein [Clostridia bacterium]
MKKRIDHLGRIGIPKHIREDMQLDENSNIIIDYNSEEKQIQIKKAKNTCSLCGDQTDLEKIDEKNFLCNTCLKNIKNKLV